jgi:hypothetical protein
MSPIRRLSLQQLRLRRKLERLTPPRPDHRPSTSEKLVTENAKKAMAIHDDLPPNLRQMAKERQDFQKAKWAGYATDIEDA